MKLKQIKTDNARALLLFIILLVLMAYKTFSQTIEEVRKELTKQGIKHAEIVLAQSILECGWNYDSYNAKTNNNLFGLVYKGKYLKFYSWQQSITSYKKIQDSYYVAGDYYEFLKCMWKHRDGSCVPYAADVKYVDKLKLINKEL